MTPMPIAPATRVPSWALYLLLGGVFLFNAHYFARNNHRLFFADAWVASFFETSDRGNEVSAVSGDDSGLKAGDRIEKINGLPWRGFSQVDRARYLGRPGDLVFLDVDSGGVKHSVTHRWTRSTFRQAPAAQVAAVIFIHILVPWFSLLFGCWVVYQRPRDPLAWLFLFLMLSITRFVDPGGAGWENGVRQVTVFSNSFLSDANAAAFLLLGMYLGFVWPGRKLMLASWSLVVAKAVDSALTALELTWTRERGLEVDALHQIVKHASIASDVLAYSCYGLMFYLLFGKYHTSQSPDVRRRLRILLAALNVSLLPAFVFFTARSYFNYQPPVWLNILVFALFCVVPFSLAYVILVHRAVDVGVVIRNGLQYTMARGGVFFLQLAVAIVGIILAVRFMENQHHLGPGVHAAILAAYAALLFAIRWISAPLFRWIDRHFFREAYSSEQLMADLTEKIRTVLEPQELFETVSHQLREALHVNDVTFFLRNGNGYQPAYATGGQAVSLFPPDSAVARKLAGEHEPMQLFLDDDTCWCYAPDVPAGDRERLVSLNTQVLLPLTASDGLLGFASLGPKRSEAPYTRNDLRLLKAVATQAGLALENSRLATSLAEEAAQKEGAHRELEIASQVQQRLFPQKPLVTAEVEIVGTCRPALAVGGDYFDYFPLENGTYGFAVGDVAGKGLGAALVMATLQASLRTQVLDGDPDLAALMTRLNQVVYEASTRNRFATLFYGQYNPGTRMLVYVNAGHNPPFVIRAGRGMERLRLTGIAVGLRRKQPFTQASIRLAPGDTVVAFTDGISEAMNPAREEWGEERLAGHLAVGAGLAPADLLTGTLRAADGFAAGAVQHDDMTMVVLSIFPSKDEPERR